MKKSIMRMDIATTLLAFVALLLNISFFQLTSGFHEVAIDKLVLVDNLKLRSVVGPESVAFDIVDGGPYTGVSDGRILKWQGDDIGWTEFAVNSEHRIPECEGTNDTSLESICGRPLGLQFHRASGTLYIADAYFGLLAVGPQGGAAVQLASRAEGGPFQFTNGLDVDQSTGAVYFTDSSTNYHRPDFILVVLMNDSTGRLMKYDPVTHSVTVLLHGLPYPNGVALSDDNTFLLFAETGLCRIIKYWLRGHRAGKTEVFAELPGYPDNIRRTASGEFWVAITREKIDLNEENGNFVEGVPEEHAVAMKFSREGKALKVLKGGMMTSVSEVMEISGAIWMGSVEMPFVSVYKL